MKVGVFCLFLLFSYASPMGKCLGNFFSCKPYNSEYGAVKKFGEILENQNSDLVWNIRDFIDAIGVRKNIVKECLSTSLPGQTVFLLYSRYAESVDDFDWIIKKMQWCGGGSFVWQQMSILNNLRLSFFHEMVVVNSYESILFMFNMICKYAPSPRDLRAFLLNKNDSNESILTCISYSSKLSADEKILFLKLFINKIKDSLTGKSKEGGQFILPTLLMDINESLLFEVIYYTLVLQRRFVDWLLPFIKELVSFTFACCGQRAVEHLVNKIENHPDGNGSFLTALDLLLLQNKLNEPNPVMDELIDFLRGVGAKTYQEI